jgi:hypothetical protein
MVGGLLANMVVSWNSRDDTASNGRCQCAEQLAPWQALQSQLGTSNVIS